MDLTLSIPDDLAGRLGASGVDLPRRALEAFALEETRTSAYRRQNHADCRDFKAGTNLTDS